MTGSRRPLNVKAYARAVVAMLMIGLWVLTTFSGIILFLAPSGPRSGQVFLLLGLTKEGWGDAHLWLSLLAMLVTLAHVAIDWKTLTGCARYLMSAHRDSRADA